MGSVLIAISLALSVYPSPIVQAVLTDITLLEVHAYLALIKDVIIVTKMAFARHVFLAIIRIQRKNVLLVFHSTVMSAYLP
jgi:hypothetical protein